MMHISVPAGYDVEFINETQISPFVSKVQIKVCYVSDEPNRNGTVITKSVAREMGRFLPGSPIVGCYHKDIEDFGAHDRRIELSSGEMQVIDLTKAYGFVDINANVWFQKYIDDGSVEREYLVTEGYIWTKQYEESKEPLERGCNQSMELDKETMKGHWTERDREGNRFFIFSEALIDKLCILGEDSEPCYEGAQVRLQFSNEIAQLKEQMYSMIKDFEKGGLEQLENENMTSAATEELEQVVTESSVETVEEAVVEEISENFQDNSEETPASEIEETVEEEKMEVNEEYEALKANYSALENQYNELLAEVESLRQFKLAKDREAKQVMIDSFYMLSEEDKQDVVTNIDVYSLDDIEAKLSVICVRNKVSFSLEEEQAETAPNITYALDSLETDTVPDWIKAVKETQKTL